MVKESVGLVNETFGLRTIAYGGSLRSLAYHRYDGFTVPERQTVEGWHFPRLIVRLRRDAKRPKRESSKTDGGGLSRQRWLALQKADETPELPNPGTGGMFRLADQALRAENRSAFPTSVTHADAIIARTAGSP
jgi:hypothetical protein